MASMLTRRSWAGEPSTMMPECALSESVMALPVVWVSRITLEECLKYKVPAMICNRSAYCARSSQRGLERRV